MWWQKRLSFCMHCQYLRHQDPREGTQLWNTLVLNPFPECNRTWKFHLVMSLPAMTFGDRFCFSRKGGIGGGGWCTQRVQTTWPSLGSTLEMPWLALGGPLLSSFAWTGGKNSPLALYSTHFWWGSLYPSLGKQLQLECECYCKLVNEWVWFESQTCRGWL